jgi:hypothetical protein
VHVGGDHAHDSSIACIPEDKIMFLGDCLSFDLYHGPHRCTMAQIVPLYERLLGFDVERYLSGHNPEPLPRSAMLDDMQLFKKIGRTVIEYASDRAAILAALPGVLGTALDEDHIEIAGAFLEGLRKPIVESVW